MLRRNTHVRQGLGVARRKDAVDERARLGIDHRLTREVGLAPCSATMPGWVAYDNGLPSALGWSKGNETPYIAWFDRDANINGVSAWDLRTGSVKELLRTPGYKDPKNGYC